MRKGLWSPDEDERLVRCITKYVNGSWSDIARKAGLDRCGKSCRRRWMNHLRPDLKRGKFSTEEINLIIRLQESLGNRWSDIAGHLEGRTDNDVKNLWNTQIKKRLSLIGAATNHHQRPYHSKSSSASRIDNAPADPALISDHYLNGGGINQIHGGGGGASSSSASSSSNISYHSSSSNHHHHHHHHHHHNPNACCSAGSIISISSSDYYSNQNPVDQSHNNNQNPVDQSHNNNQNPVDQSHMSHNPMNRHGNLGDGDGDGDCKPQLMAAADDQSLIIHYDQVMMAIDDDEDHHKSYDDYLLADHKPYISDSNHRRPDQIVHPSNHVINNPNYGQNPVINHYYGEANDHATNPSGHPTNHHYMLPAINYSASSSSCSSSSSATNPPANNSSNYLNYSSINNGHEYNPSPNPNLNHNQLINNNNNPSHSHPVMLLHPDRPNYHTPNLFVNLPPHPHNQTHINHHHPNTFNSRHGKEFIECNPTTHLINNYTGSNPNYFRAHGTDHNYNHNHHHHHHHPAFNPDSYIQTHAGVSLEPDHHQQILNHHHDGDAPALNPNHHHHHHQPLHLDAALNPNHHHPYHYPAISAISNEYQIAAQDAVTMLSTINSDDHLHVTSNPNFPVYGNHPAFTTAAAANFHGNEIMDENPRFRSGDEQVGRHGEASSSGSNSNNDRQHSIITMRHRPNPQTLGCHATNPNAPSQGLGGGNVGNPNSQLGISHDGNMEGNPNPNPNPNPNARSACDQPRQHQSQTLSHRQRHQQHRQPASCQV